MHCTSCAMNIDGELEDTDGIDVSCTSYAKSETQVEFNEEIIKINDVIKIIEKTGYTAQIL